MEPINLKTSLPKTSSYYTDLVKELKLNKKETDIFLDHFSISFYYINKWMKWPNQNLSEFISFHKNIRKISIMKAFENENENENQLFQKIIQEENIKKWNLKRMEKSFLKSIYLIVEDVQGEIEHYDNLSKISLDDMRKEGRK